MQLKLCIQLICYFVLINSDSFCIATEKDLLKISLLSDQEQFLMSTFGLINFRTENGLVFTKFANPTSWIESTVKSIQKYKEGKHKFSLKIVQSINKKIQIGICSDQTLFKSNFLGNDETTFSFNAADGTKYTRGQSIPYGVKCEAGDVISVILDLTTSYGTVEYLRNNVSMALAFTDVKQLGNIQFAFSVYDINDTVEISYLKL